MQSISEPGLRNSIALETHDFKELEIILFGGVLLLGHYVFVIKLHVKPLNPTTLLCIAPHDQNLLSVSKTVSLDPDKADNQVRE